jgi:uncharacterized protein YbjT (DUF2867 family)
LALIGAVADEAAVLLGHAGAEVVIEASGIEMAILRCPEAGRR